MEDYFEDFINQVIEKAVVIKNSSNSEFDNGKLFGYYEIISLMLNQAEAFGVKGKIPSKWQNYNPEELLSRM